MNIRIMVLLSALFALPAWAADGPPSSAAAEGKPPYGQHGAMREACKADPEKCREMKARAEQRRTQCAADPEQCRRERLAQREQWCAQNPEKCKERKTRAERRRAQCAADPAQCKRERKARHDDGQPRRI